MLKTILVGLVCMTQCIFLYAKEPSLSGLSAIEQVTLKMTCKKGVFEGYIVFHDKAGDPRRVVPPITCQKKSQDPVPCLYARAYNFKKVLDIRPPRFKHYLINKKFAYAYKIEPFLISDLEKGDKVVFELEWCDLKSTDTVFMLE